MKKAASSLFVLFISMLWLICADSITVSRHNLSTSGTGGITGDTSEICIFCHTSHNAASYAPLWNREDPIPAYSIYTSSTLLSTPGQPDGASKLCLSCHDGTIALGSVLSQETNFTVHGTVRGKMPPGKPANLGTDLTDDHPVSFVPDSGLSEIQDPPPGDSVRYDADGKVQCTACHDPHDNRFGNFFVKDDINGGLCKTCHVIQGFEISTHDVSGYTWNGTGRNPWPLTGYVSVVANSCYNCHKGHAAGGSERLLNKTEEDNCLICHSGNVGQDIQSVLSGKTFKHDVESYNGIHDPTEDTEFTGIHVECSDCHNPHQANDSPASAPDVNGRLKGVSGRTVSSIRIDPSQAEYQVCLDCHGLDKYIVSTPITRLFDTRNIGYAINPANASHHAFGAQGTGSWVPSLIPPYTTSSRLYCVSCHNSDTSVYAGGSGPNGPHGSNYEFLLEREYEVTDFTLWSVDRYAMCYKCHNSYSLFDNAVSGFENHQAHVQGQNTPCSVCHDPHGSPDYIGLLNFDTNIVFPNGNGDLKFEVIGTKGYCYLTCHGRDHNPLDYDRK